jgi:hypothetical protein
MLRSLAEWAWRLAMLAAVLWVGWQVVQLREDVADLVDPGDDSAEIADSTVLLQVAPKWGGGALT